MDTSLGITLIGAGRVGTNLLHHLYRKKLNILAVVEPDFERHAAIRAFLPTTRVLATLPPSMPHETDICILCVPDQHIIGTAEALAQSQALPSDAMVFHVSGLRGSEDLLALEEMGLTAGCIHPIQSFSDAPLTPEQMEGIGCGIEGNDRFWKHASTFAERIAWQPLRIPADRKALYHAACVFAGNFTTVIAAQAELLLRAASSDGKPVNDLLHPMMETVLQRLRDIPPEKALTGPAVRADGPAITAHLGALEGQPELLAVYRVLTRSAVHLSSLSENEKKTIITMLDATA